MEKKFDVLTVGNAIMDVFATCDDTFLSDRSIGKGMMNLVDADPVSYTHLTLPTKA